MRRNQADESASSLTQNWRKKLVSVAIGCWTAGCLAGSAEWSVAQAQQSVPRAYAPPVHIAPGSATALPPNRHRPRATPGLELAKIHPSGEPVGIQDRLAQQFSRSRSRIQNPTLTRAIPVGNSNPEVVGSGLRSTRIPQPAGRRSSGGSSVDSRDTGCQDCQSRSQTYDVNNAPYASRQPRQAAIESGAFTGNSVNLEETDESIEGGVRPVMAQEPESGPPPIRHAFVQDQYLRKLPPRVASQQQEYQEFEQEFEWVEEPNTLQVEPAPSNPTRAQPQRVPARPTSVLRRQDQEQDDASFRPQPAPEQAQPKADDPSELVAPGGQADRPKSLLDMDEDPDSPAQDDDANGKKPTASLLDQTCEEFRSELLNTSIRDISLDISPPAINTNQTYMGISRSWTDRQGQIIATGTMLDLRRGYIFLDNGQKIAFARLSEADLAAVSEHWNLPKSCLVASQGTVERCWQPQIYHWTASSLCHKPLYFENIQLERYGHTHGPIMQPVRSVAHFFVSLVTLPYQTAIHPPNECEYPLGLYRPGDCAPWLKEPIPISLDGLRRQGLVTTGLAFIP